MNSDGHMAASAPAGATSSSDPPAGLAYRRMLCIARFIEYGGKLAKNETRETVIECKRRPKGKACLALMWVVKTDDDGILAHCMACKTEEAFIHNWQKTEWAEGMMEPVPVEIGGPTVH